jgi:hypothetical protein
VFSPDGAHIIYRAQTGGGQTVVIDGQEEKVYDLILSGIKFESPGRLHYLAVKDEIIYLVGRKTPHAVKQLSSASVVREYGSQ